MSHEATSGSFECLNCKRTMKTVIGGQTCFCSQACNKKYIARTAEEGQKANARRSHDGAQAELRPNGP